MFRKINLGSRSNTTFSLKSKFPTHSAQVFSKNAFFSAHQARPFCDLNNTALVAMSEQDPTLKDYPIKISEIGMAQKKLDIPPLRGPKSPVTWLSFNRSGTHLLAGTLGDNQLYLWQFPNEASKTFGTFGNVSRVAFNEEGTLLAFVAQDTFFAKVSIINIQDINKPITIHLRNENGNFNFSGQISSLAFHPKSDRLVASDRNIPGNVYFWELDQINENKVDKARRVLVSHGLAMIEQLVFDSTGIKLAGTNLGAGGNGKDGKTGFIIPNSKNPDPYEIITLKTENYWVNSCIAFSPNDQYLVTGGQYLRNHQKFSVVRLWDTKKGEWLNKSALSDDEKTYFLGHENRLTSFVSFNEESNQIVFGDNENFICTSSLDGKSGAGIGRYPSLKGFCYPVRKTLSLKEELTTSPSYKGLRKE